MPAPLKSFLAVAAGFVLTAALALGTDALLHLLLPAHFDAAGGTEDSGALASMLAYTLVYVAAGCSFAAFLAPIAPWRHALGLGLISLAFTLFWTLRAWDAAPAWYHFSLLGLWLPAACLGGLLGARSRADSPSGADLED